MPSSLVVMAVAYGAGSAATALGISALGAAVIGAAAAATVGTAMNGGSWGEQFGMGLIGAGVASGISSAIGSATASGIGEGAGSATGSGLSEGASQSFGSGLTDGATTGLGSSATPGLESSLGGMSGLEGSISSGAAGSGTDLSSMMNAGGANDYSSLASQGTGSAGNSATGAFDSGAGFGMNDGNSIATPSSIPSGEGMAGGGMEGFQTNSPLNYTGTSSPQLGSGMYNLNSGDSLGFNGSDVTGGFSNLGTTPIPNAGADVVTPWEKDLQTVKNGLGNLWDSTGIGFNAKTGLKAAGGLYDMYARNQAAKGYNQTLNSLNNMYAPGSAEYNLLQQKLDRQNAAAGRRSQSLTNAGNFAQQVATQRTQALTSPQYLSTMNARNQNKFNGLGSLFNFAGGMF